MRMTSVEYTSAVDGTRMQPWEGEKLESSVVQELTELQDARMAHSPHISHTRATVQRVPASPCTVEVPFSVRKPYAPAMASLAMEEVVLEDERDKSRV